MKSSAPAAVRTGKASRTSTDVTTMFHVKMGMRNTFIVGHPQAEDGREDVDAR